jgi:DNA invertase Pin-like site-specific DNA recombinase
VVYLPAWQIGMHFLHTKGYVSSNLTVGIYKFEPRTIYIGDIVLGSNCLESIMYSKIKEKELAIKLRKNGCSINEISKKLNVSKGSVSSWLKNLFLTPEEEENLSKNNKLKYVINFDRHRKKLNQEKKDRIIEFIKAGEKLASDDQLFMVICSLYWGEGAKTLEYFKIANSDHKMLNLVWNWLNKNDYNQKVKFSVIYHKENKLESKEILNWWVEALPGLNKSQCKCYVKKSEAKNKKIGKLPYGVGYLSVYSVEFFYKVMGGIEFLKKNFISNEIKEAL